MPSMKLIDIEQRFINALGRLENAVVARRPQQEMSQGVSQKIIDDYEKRINLSEKVAEESVCELIVARAEIAQLRERLLELEMSIGTQQIDFFDQDSNSICQIAASDLDKIISRLDSFIVR